ncbi:hypothetical protein AB0F88_00990 [Streptosporangium sp. NPDC023963]|uniref:hypothetical protein n=1 Tax=Streptosporangium sp. NPDC023963 TaxID=3155608 RepID=UPI00343BE7F9
MTMPAHALAGHQVLAATPPAALLALTCALAVGGPSPIAHPLVATGVVNMAPVRQG